MTGWAAANHVPWVHGEHAELSLLAPIDGFVVDLSGVPDRAFSSRMIGDGSAVDPTSQLLKAPCFGEVGQVHPGKHALTLHTELETKILIHVGVDSVKLGGNGFRQLVKKGDWVEPGQSLLEFDLDRVAQVARSVVTAMVVTETSGRLHISRMHGFVTAGCDRLAFLQRSAVVGGDELTIMNAHGLHAQPAALLATAIKRFDAVVFVQRGRDTARASSVTELLGLGLMRGDKVRLSANGPDAQEALAAAKELIESGLGEPLTQAAPAEPFLDLSPTGIDLSPTGIDRKRLLAALGGAGNLRSLAACATSRLRVELYDGARLDRDRLTGAGVPASVSLRGGRLLHLIVGVGAAALASELQTKARVT